MEPRLNGIWSLACSEPVRSQLRTSSEQAVVMEFGFKHARLSSKLIHLLIY